MVPEGVHLHQRVLTWGNSYRIRLTASDVEELGLSAGDEVEVVVRSKAPAVDPTTVGMFHWGPNASQEIDEVLYQGYLDDERRRKRKARK